MEVSSTTQHVGSSSLSNRVIFGRLLITDSNISSKLLLLVGKESAKCGFGRCLEVTLRWMLVEFHASPFGLKLRLARTRCLKLYGFYMSGQEIPPMALPLVDISLSLQEAQFLLSPCHLIPEYEQDSYLRLLETVFRRDASFHISSSRLGSLTLHLPCARHEYFCVGSMVLAPVLWAASRDPLAAGGLVRNRH
eukprot:Gb_36847 [translate_table: standard]